MIIAYISKLKREASKRPSIVRFESTKKRQRQYNILDSIQRTQKRRDEIQKPAGMRNIMSKQHLMTPVIIILASSSRPRSTIETHGTNANGQRLPTAMELSLHKSQRDRQMQHAFLEQRQLSAGYPLQRPAVSI